jgi:glyoxalase family protein
MDEHTLTGIHHVTAIAADPQRNLDFYTGVLGLRLVKLTVNFDDPGTYHFYFGDASGSPGSILTFFPWPGVGRGTVGSGQVSVTSFAVPAGSIDYWRRRLTGRGAPVEGAPERFGDEVLAFEDPDGLRLELIATDLSGPSAGWEGSSVDRGHAIRGFHSATLLEEGYERTAALLQNVMGSRLVGTEGNRVRFRMGSGDAAAAIVDVVCAPDGRPGRLGGGTVHHIAWRTPDDAQQLAWRRRLVGEGTNVSPVMDRTYFHSIYYREPGGILFEIATDPPGFALDEPPEHLGERLMLPAQYEPYRSVLERKLPRLTLPAPR